jgi:hypothetical protein
LKVVFESSSVGSNKVEVEVDVERINQIFVNDLDFDIPMRLSVPEFSLISVDSKDVFDAFLAL